MDNLFHDIPSELSQELTEILLQRSGIRVERIVSRGHASPDGFWYDQQEHELVFVLRGSARLQFVDAVRELKPGDYVRIPARCRHRVEWTAPDEPTIWLAIFYD